MTFLPRSNNTGPSNNENLDCWATLSIIPGRGNISPGNLRLENNNEDIYRLFPLPSLDSFHDLVSQTGHLCGLNITLPYKISIIPYLNDVDETAAKIGSVNTVLVSQGNTNRLTKGFNTDILGFEKSLKPHLSPLHKKALIFGTGGASKSVAFVLGLWDRI